MSVDRQGIDTRERLVQQDEGGARRERAGDLGTPPLAAGKRAATAVTDMPEIEFLDQDSRLVPPLFAAGLDRFQHHHDVFFDTEAGKNRRLLRQISDTHARAHVERERCHVIAVDLDHAAVGGNDAGDHVEYGRFAGAVRTEQPDGFAAGEIEADVPHHVAAAKLFCKPRAASHSGSAIPGRGGMERMGQPEFNTGEGLAFARSLLQSPMPVRNFLLDADLGEIAESAVSTIHGCRHMNY